MRLLVIADRADYRLLARKHVEIEWPDANLVEHRLGEDNPLEAQFAAAGFDAVIIVAAPPTDAAEALAAGFLAKAEFAPIVLLMLEDAPRPEPPAVPGLHRLYGRKLDRQRLIRAITAASREHKQALSMLRALPDFEQRYRFGSVIIRGHRCIRQVGSGGMCTIYLAESERAGTVVVLKVFNQVPDVSERIVGFDRFLQEYEIVAGLKHQNIVRIYDLGIADDHAYIAMEHFPAGDLRQRMKAPLSPATALRYLEQIASALRAIHDVGVLHRDLKPANVMLRTDGSLCLIDFGLAKANGMEVSLTGTREIFGTPYYMSPEQGHAEEIDRRSDLYSLGVMFYEMLVGRKPYTGATAMEVIYKHKRAELPEVAPEFADYREVLHRLLAKAPADRYQSADALLQALAAFKIPGVIRAAAPGFQPLLRVPTPAAWIARACEMPEVLLIDHANCEKKAASTALALMFAYAEDLELADKMSRLAREELRHYEQVAKLIRRMGIVPRRLAPGRYAERLRRLAAKSEPHREVDLMLCGAFIEARSCERFAALGGAIGAPLSELFQGLHNAEARHHRVYLDLARRAAGRAGLALETRIGEFAALEAELIVQPDPVFRFHSGPP